MHISEGLLPLSHCLVWGAVSAPFVVVASRDLSRMMREGETQPRALAGMAVAITFAVTLLPLPVPGVGVSSHLCATPLLALVLGPRVMAAPAAVVLLLQALFFAHGGLTTIGANIFTLGIVGPWTAFALARLFRGAGVASLWAVGLACGLADAIVYVVDAGIVAAGVAPHGSVGAVFRTILIALSVPQGPLAVLEGVVSAVLVSALARRREGIVPAWLPFKGRTLPTVATIAALVAWSGIARADPLPGLDEAAFERIATLTGHPPRAPFLDLGGAQLAAMLIAFFATGAVAGWAWQRLASDRPIADGPMAQGEGS